MIHLKTFELFNFLKGADDLEIRVLIESLCKTIADMMAGLTPEELSKEFDVPKTLKPNDEDITHHRHGDGYGYGYGYGYGHKRSRVYGQGAKHTNE